MNRKIFQTNIPLWIALLTSIIGAVAYVSRLEGKLDGLDPERIREAQETAISAIRNESERLLPLDGSRSEEFALAVNDDEEWVDIGPETTDRVPYSRQMIRVDEGICFLTDIGGKFQGLGERIWIEQQDEYWYAHAYTDQPLRAKITCWRFRNPS